MPVPPAAGPRRRQAVGQRRHAGWLCLSLSGCRWCNDTRVQDQQRCRALYCVCSPPSPATLSSTANGFFSSIRLPSSWWYPMCSSTVPCVWAVRGGEKGGWNLRMPRRKHDARPAAPSARPPCPRLPPPPPAHAGGGRERAHVEGLLQAAAIRAFYLPLHLYHRPGGDLAAHGPQWDEHHGGAHAEVRAAWVIRDHLSAMNVGWTVHATAGGRSSFELRLGTAQHVRAAGLACGSLEHSLTRHLVRGLFPLALAFPRSRFPFQLVSCLWPAAA